MHFALRNSQHYDHYHWNVFPCEINGVAHRQPAISIDDRSSRRSPGQQWAHILHILRHVGGKPLAYATFSLFWLRNTVYFGWETSVAISISQSLFSTRDTIFFLVQSLFHWLSLQPCFCVRRQNTNNFNHIGIIQSSIYIYKRKNRMNIVRQWTISTTFPSVSACVCELGRIRMAAKLKFDEWNMNSMAPTVDIGSCGSVGSSIASSSSV